MTVLQTMTGKKLKRKILKKTNNRSCEDHILVHNNRRVDTNQPIGLQVPHEGSIMVQVVGKGGGKEHNIKRTLDVLGKLSFYNIIVIDYTSHVYSL